MDRTVAHGLKKMYRDELEDSLDTSWLSGSVQSPALFRPRLDLSHVLNQQSLHSNRTSFSISQSIDDMSFFRSEISTPRIVRASHDIKISNTSRVNTSASFYRNKPRVVTLRERTIPENLLLDSYPKKVIRNTNIR